MSLHVDIVRDTSKVIDNVAVCVIRHNVQNSSRILNILLPAWLWFVTSYCLRCNDVVEALIFHQHIQKFPNIWMVAVDRAEQSTMPPFYVVVGLRKVVHGALIHIPKLNRVYWLTPSS